MFYLILYSVIFLILIKILQPLITAIKLKIQFGDKIKIQYFPLIGLLYYLDKGFRQHNDAIHYKKSSLYNNPNLQVIVSNIVTTPFYIIVDPILAKEILQNVENYKKSGTEIFNDILVSRGLVYTEGQIWQHQRKQMGELFTHRKLMDLIPFMKERISKLLIFEPHQRVKLLQNISYVISQVILFTFFKKEELTIINGKQEADELIGLGVEVFKITYGSFWHYIRCVMGISINSDMPKIFMTKQEKQLLQRIVDYRKHVFEMIENRIKNYNPIDKDIISQMIQGKEITQDLKEEMVHQYFTFEFAGTHTTSDFVAMSLYHLAKYPNVQERLRDELKDVDFDKIDGDNIHKYQLLNAFIQECLRFVSPIDGFVPRIAARDHYIGQLFVKKGTWVDVGILPMATHPKYFENSLEFDIDRWTKIKSNDAFIPFSHGKRNCIGQNLAMINSKLILIYLIQNYLVSLDQQTTLVMSYGFAYEPVDDRLVKFERIQK
ncbi:hypothetical protein pb186bvf_005211 [Paramecium bursaria]